MNGVYPDSPYQIADGVVTSPIGNNAFAIWNRYAPAVVQVNRDTLELIRIVQESGKPYRKFLGMKRMLRELISHHVLMPLGGKPYRQGYMESVEKFHQEARSQLKAQHSNRLPFVEISFNNQACNLACPYCVVAHNQALRPQKFVRDSQEVKLERCIKLLDQFMCKSRPESWVSKRRIHFNGGEFLLEFGLLRAIVLHVKSTYPSEEIEFGINTNATLVTDEIAKFLSEHFHEVAFSLDGYSELNDKTRMYHDKRGASVDILKGVETLNRNFKKPITSFQGTLQPSYSIDYDRILDLGKAGFTSARLGINLLGITPEQAFEAAGKHFDMCVKSFEGEFRVSDSYFRNFTSVGREPAKYSKFTPFCLGLGQLAGKAVYYNVDTDTLGTMCSFALGTKLPAASVNYDLYHESIFLKTQEFLLARLQAFQLHCMSCEVAAVCRGGCLMTGLDSENQLNPSACAFQKETWHRYLRLRFQSPTVLAKIPETAIPEGILDS